MDRKAQLAMFAMVAVALMLAVTVLIYLSAKPRNVTSTGMAASDAAINALKLYIYQCDERVSKEALFNLSLHGGYHTVPEPRLDANGYLVPYYFAHGSKTVPSKQTLEAELAKYIQNRLPSCVETSFFTQQGFTIRRGDVKARPAIFDDRVEYTISYPITASRSSQESRFSDEKVTIDVRYGHVLAQAQSLVDKIAAAPGQKDLTYMLNLDTQPLVAPATDTSDVYTIADPDSDRMGAQKFRFIFAVDTAP